MGFFSLNRSHILQPLPTGEQGGEGDAEEAESQGVHHHQVQHQSAEEYEALELMQSASIVSGTPALCVIVPACTPCALLHCSALSAHSPHSSLLKGMYLWPKTHLDVF